MSIKLKSPNGVVINYTNDINLIRLKKKKT